VNGLRRPGGRGRDGANEQNALYPYRGLYYPQILVGF